MQHSKCTGGSCETNLFSASLHDCGRDIFARQKYYIWGITTVLGVYKSKERV